MLSFGMVRSLSSLVTLETTQTILPFSFPDFNRLAICEMEIGYRLVLLWFNLFKIALLNLESVLRAKNL